MSIPTRADLPASTSAMTREERDELAEAYLHLFGNLLDALNECDHGYGFVWWTGYSIKSTGHLPPELSERLMAIDGSQR